MVLQLEITRKLSARSDRVKSVDIHPTEPWVLASLYNGQVYVWNYKTQSAVKSFEVCELPVRTAKFIARKQWIITGSDDMFIRVYNYNTQEKIKTFEAHTDYIRCLAVHPTQPFVLSSSDDMLIKLWDWEKNWANTMVFEGHTHYVMMVAFNPRDTNTFASASLDRTVKVWGLSSPTPHFTLEGHEKGVNCVDYFTGGDKPYLITGADDKTVKVWDYQNKTCVQTLQGHTHNVSVVCFHPTLPLIVSGSEDGTVRLWNSNTYRLEKTLNYGMERVWALAYLKGTNKLALGYDEGTVLLKLGSEEPAASMAANGKIIWAKHTELQTVNLKKVNFAEAADGERLQVAPKELGSAEVYPQRLQHNSNGRFVVVCGDGEYTIYTAERLRNKSFGSGLEFVWGPGTGDYAVREGTSKVKLFKNFKEDVTLKPSFSAEGISGGFLLGVRSRTFLCFYTWDKLQCIRKVDVAAKAIYWAESGDYVTITTENSFYILKYDKEAVARYLAEGKELEEDGIEEAFEVQQEVSERVRTALWVGDCFLYTSSNNRLNYCVGGEIVTLAHLDHNLYLLGYLPAYNRLFLVDKGLNLVSYSLHLAIINYQTAVLRGDLETAARLLPEIPKEHRNKIAQFLEAQGHKELALEVATEPDLRFDLAVQLGKLDVAYDIARDADSDHKWRQLADLALAAARFDLAETCLDKAADLGGLLLLYVATGNADGLTKLARTAAEQSKNNLAFISYLLLGKLEECIDLLCRTGRHPEAAFMARTYLPSRVSHVVRLWKEDLGRTHPKAALALADPAEYPNLFPDWAVALLAEQKFRPTELLPAAQYLATKGGSARNFIQELKAIGAPTSPLPGASPVASPRLPPAAADEQAPLAKEQSGRGGADEDGEGSW